MTAYLSRKVLTVIVGGPFLIIFGVLMASYICAFESPLFFALIGSFSMAVTVVAGALALSNVTSAVIRVANRLPGVYVPDLNGAWSVRHGSNWPRIKGLLDFEGREHAESKALLTVNGLLTLKMNLFRISGTYEVLGTDSTEQSRTRESDIISASLTRRSGRTRLSYMAEAVVENPTPGLDVTKYHFSALLIFGHKSATRAKGHYATDRNWQTGLNTAGQMEITKLP